ncbi:iron chelate uptake ABC transporter family permease subunit [Thermobifida halotolerans]|uniref:Iron chelate uptake ABC transporter family permease subunit n=1 Tax=Thermobifida halotolerans TaxID=483545 RepID=A0A399G6Z2_9ACTN|nr:iron chelate uptake ABC transporter family permease subunit [Thermobifida halotolerans]UOE20712.1 iron chelate uptake ABC transporter family permease subunit [Thermobifida halotolerans]
MSTVRGAPPLLRVGNAVALPLHPRSLLWTLVLLAALLAAAAATLSLGRLGIPATELVDALTGDTTPAQEFVLRRLRGPRLVVALGTGAALGLAGALFQSVTRNPLGSPDVIGLNAGAGAGAALVALALPGVVPVPLGALLGAVLAVVVVATVTGTGLRHPGRLIVAGIGVAAMASALTHFVVAALARDQASVLYAYVNGSLSARSWEHALTIWLTLALAAPPLAALARPVALNEMGDELADSLGARAAATRAAAITLSVVLSAAAVGVAGPIAFVSLTAPQIARRLTRAAGPNLVVSALVGALILALADLAVQQVPLGEGLPVGIVTLAVGGVYLGFLLVREWRRGVL